MSKIIGVLPKKFIKQMSGKAKSKAKKRLILSHLISVYILSLIFRANKEGKDRFDCVISTEKLTEVFKKYFPTLKVRKKIEQDLNQLEVAKVISLQRFSFPQVDYVPTERIFNLIVKIFKGMTKGDITFLEDKLVTIFYVKVVNEATHEVLRTEDAKLGDTIPMLRSFFRIRNGELEWFIPKKSAIKEMKIKHAKKLSELKKLVKQVEEVI